MVKYFDVEMFIKSLTSKNDISIKTVDIARWNECTVRHIQKWAINNEVKNQRIDGRKYYIWTEDKIREFALYYNRNFNKPKKKYYIPVKKKLKEPEIELIDTEDNILDIF